MSGLIGVAGYARSGKDSVAGILIAERGYRRAAFADILKAVLADVNPMMGAHTRLSDRLEAGWEHAKSDPEVRQLLQRLGESCRRRIGPHVWVGAVFRYIEFEIDRTGHNRWVIPDVRFGNELEAIRSRGGQVWRVERPGVGPANGHISEHALDGAHFDQHIPNDGTLTDLRRVVLDLVDCLVDPLAVDPAVAFADDVH